MSEPIPFRRHPIEWTPEKVMRFWDWLGSSQPDEAYFARMHGAEIVELARAHGVLRGRALDFGAGRGFLVEHLLAAGVATTALDLSRESLERIERSFAGRPGFEGTHHVSSLPTGLGAASFELAFLLETVEHLSDGELEATLGELARLLRAGGALVITTPNEEKLQARMVMCPDCGCEFHRVQHVRSVSAAWLAERLRAHGLDVHASVETALGGPPLARLRGRLHRFLRGKRAPNLIVIAKKR